MEITNRFQIFLVLIYSRIYIITCDNMIAMLTDGEFTQAVTMIEAKIGEITQGGEPAELTEVEKDGKVSYFLTEDQTHPIFTRHQGKTGEKLVVLSRGEDYFSKENRYFFACLVQKSGSTYNLHLAYIDNLGGSDDVDFIDAKASIVDGAEMVLALFGNHEHEQDSASHCGWFGAVELLCCITTMQERAVRAMEPPPGMGGDDGSENPSETEGGTRYPTKTPRPKRPIGEDLTIPDGSEYKKPGTPGSGGSESSKPGGGGVGSGGGGVGPSGGTGSSGSGKGPNKGDGPNGGNGPSGGGGGGPGAEGAEGSEETFITIKLGDKSAAKGRKLGSMVTRKGGRTMPQGRVSKRQTRQYSRPTH